MSPWYFISISWESGIAVLVIQDSNSGKRITFRINAEQLKDIGKKCNIGIPEIMYDNSKDAEEIKE